VRGQTRTETPRPLPKTFPEGLSVDCLDVSGTDISELPAGLSAYELDASETLLTELPADLKVRSRLILQECVRLESLPDNLRVGTLILRGCSGIRELPEGLDVWFLDLAECWALERWPQVAKIRNGELNFRGCRVLRELPDYLGRLSALNVRDCSELVRLPDDLTVTGWIDLAHSGLHEESQLPAGLQNTQLRWGGVNIDRRIAFRPDEIEVDEILNERNAERRRVLIDRYGYGNFLTDADADVLNEDTDPGGPRQLLRLQLQDDEDLVALSCFCPSTQKQYIIRVPPTTTTCHQAAAWIAGFDNEMDYRPVMET
jgi:hypothetical protein